jgi:phosphoglycerate dehydrogenase-like enzyme
MTCQPKKVALIGNADQIAEVYSGGRRERIGSEFELYPEILSADSLGEARDELTEIEFLFSTWGMPVLDPEQITLLPALKAIFYGAGTVQRFARPLLDAGVRVFSAWAANAVPVAEYTVAQILLCNKGFFSASRATRSLATRREHKRRAFPGNFDNTVSLLGAGMIGRGVIERLAPYSLTILVFDPFLSDDAAADLGVEKVTLEDAFRRGFVVSNHLANLPETKGMLRGEHFESMPPHASFINTGRGATVDEPAMIEVLRKRPDLTAVLDVTDPEPPVEGSGLYELENVVMTPHIAGSLSREIHRMADYAIEEAMAFRDGRELKYEVTLEMLDTMA